jgi:PncC family amidohydrolase
VISYSNAAKEHLLGVPPGTLAAYGAVSQPAAQEMAQRVRHLFGADIGLSVTGIAGPGGGTPDKPVGLVYVGLSAEGQELCRRFVWSGSREENKAASAQAALDLLADHLGCHAR